MSESMFKGMVFHLHNLSQTDRNWILSMASAFGGQFSKKIGPNTTHVIVGSDFVDENLQKWIAPFPKVVLLKQAFVKDCLYNQALVKVARYAIDRPPADANISDDNGVADTANAINNGGARNTEEGTTDDDDVFVLQSKVAHPADQDNVDDINPTTDPPGTQLTYFVDDEDADDSYVFPVPKKKKIADFEEVPVPRSIALRSDAADNDKEVCPYDPKCYRKNPVHFEQYSHPKRDAHLRNTTLKPAVGVDADEPAPASAPKPTPALATAVSAPAAHATLVTGSNANIPSYVQPTWTHNGSLYVMTSASVKHSTKIAAFDMDSTLIITKSGNKFAKDRNDWRWMLPETKPALVSLFKKGYKIVIFTNQAGAEKSKEKATALTGKILDLAKNIGIPLMVFMAAAKDVWRKPNTLMWDELCEKYNGGIKVSYTDSFYVGDAAGRALGWKPGAPKDFSAGDRMFAHNVGLPFHTPEEYFLGEDKASFSWGHVNPSEIVSKLERAKTKPFTAPMITSSSQEIIVMVGFPASGKSSFVKKYLAPKGYERVNRDTLGTQEKCVSVAASALASGKSVVVDNTCPDVATRAKYVALGNKFRVKLRCFVMQTSLEFAQHLNQFREKITKGVVKRIPDIAYNTYRSKFSQPTVGEGFTEIVPITWVPEFPDDAHRKLFLQFTES